MMDPVGMAVFLFGAMIGSFLNVCIVRLPQEKSVAFPGSHCVRCSKAIAWYDNIPLVSWLLLRGRCRHCGANFSIRYWMVELLTALVFWGLYLYYGTTPLWLPYAVMASGFIVATFVDFEHRIIPDEVSLGGMWAGLAFSAFIPQLHPVTLQDVQFSAFLAGLICLICLGLALIYPVFCRHLMEESDGSHDRGVKILVAVSLGIIAALNYIIPSVPLSWLPQMLSISASLSGYLIGGGIIYAMGLLGDIIFRKESMGGGDVKLMAMIGAFMGWKLAVLTFFVAPFFGAVYGIASKIITKDSTIAYGPFLIAGAVVSLFWGEAIIDWVLRGGIYGL